MPITVSRVLAGTINPGYDQVRPGFAHRDAVPTVDPGHVAYPKGGRLLVSVRPDLGPGRVEIARFIFATWENGRMWAKLFS